jgi:hypothetical protein
MKTLYISLLTSLIIVLGGWALETYLFNNNVFFGAMYGVPGLLILSSFKGAWVVIHCNPWYHLIPIVSFLFYVVVIFVVVKGGLYIKRKCLPK